MDLTDADFFHHNFWIGRSCWLYNNAFFAKIAITDKNKDLQGYIDISSFYGDSLIGQKITNISFITDEKDVVEFHFHLSNGKILSLFENCDLPLARLYHKEYKTSEMSSREYYDMVHGRNRLKKFVIFLLNLLKNL